MPALSNNNGQFFNNLIRVGSCRSVAKHCYVKVRTQDPTENIPSDLVDWIVAFFIQRYITVRQQLLISLFESSRLKRTVSSVNPTITLFR